jgi:hypothetical protein
MLFLGIKKACGKGWISDERKYNQEGILRLEDIATADSYSSGSG